MDVEIRALVDDADEIRSFLECDATAFGAEVKDDDADRLRAFLELDRTRAALEDGRVVGTSAALSWEVTVPGGQRLPSAAVTWVSVRSTHRRRGILRAMMAALLDDAVERGEPLAMLFASESAIYGRFGYGLATSTATYEIARPHAALRTPAPPPGRLVALSAADAEPVVRAVFEEHRLAQHGEVARSEGWWRRWFEDRADERGGASVRYYVAHERAPGVWDGYAAYRLGERWDGPPDYTLHADEVVGLTPDTRMALVAHLLDVDLVSRVRLPFFPVDDPIRWALTDPRRLRVVALDDALWVRVLDVPRALAARTYPVAGRLVLDVEGTVCTLEGGPDGATCVPGARGGDVDVTLGVAELGALYLGGTAAAPLAASGRLTAASADALTRVTAMFRTDPAPYCRTEF